jgi:hypothetical protein
MFFHKLFRDGIYQVQDRSNFDRVYESLKPAICFTANWKKALEQSILNPKRQPGVNISSWETMGWGEGREVSTDEITIGH